MFSSYDTFSVHMILSLESSNTAIAGSHWECVRWDSGAFVLSGETQQMAAGQSQ